jgi:monofunctional glycosyltransferase
MIRFIFKLIGKLALGFMIISILWVLIYMVFPVPYTPLMIIRYFDSPTSTSIQHEWIPIEEISPSLQLAVICAEDQNFTTHHGFDYASIQKAFENNKKGGRIKGGSTISQQTAKNIFLWPDRSWLRKGLETYFTFLIELFWSKERILEVYLNSIEMGQGVYGAEAASQYWFDKNAIRLSSQEAAALACILPNPLQYKASPRSQFIERRTQWVLRQMKNYGTFQLSQPESE